MLKFEVMHKSIMHWGIDVLPRKTYSVVLTFLVLKQVQIKIATEFQYLIPHWHWLVLGP